MMTVRSSLLGVFVLAAVLSFVVSAAAQTTAGLHIPRQGSAERKAILDALRTDDQVSFKVHFLKVHNGWAWIDVTPLGKDGKPVAEGGPSLLHHEQGEWKVQDLSKVPEDPHDPLGPEDASRGFVRNLRKTFPGVPADIFPKPKH